MNDWCKKLACAMVALVSGSVSAQVFIPSTNILPLPNSAGEGLSAAVWNEGVNSLDAAEQFAATNPASASFLSTHLDYPNGALDVVEQAVPFADFLGVDGPSLQGTANDSFSVIIRLTGYIAIELPGIVNFAVGSDDGFVLRINGETVMAETGDRGFAFTGGAAEFEDLGLYPIELVYYANGFGQSGIEFYSDLEGEIDSGAPVSGMTIVSQNRLYIPTPGASALMLVAGLLAMPRVRRGA